MWTTALFWGTPYFFNLPKQGIFLLWIQTIYSPLSAVLNGVVRACCHSRRDHSPGRTVTSVGDESPGRNGVAPRVSARTVLYQGVETRQLLDEDFEPDLTGFPLWCCCVILLTPFMLRDCVCRRCLCRVPHTGLNSIPPVTSAAVLKGGLGIIPT